LLFLATFGRCNSFVSAFSGAKGDYPIKTSGVVEPGLLFLVFVPNHEYRIYADGRVEGFGDDVKIINRFFQCCSDLLQETQDQQLAPPEVSAEAVRT
jgi:hypothetical protein